MSEHAPSCYITDIRELFGAVPAPVEALIAAAEAVDLCGCREASERRAKVRFCKFGCCVVEAVLVAASTPIGGDVMAASEASRRMTTPCTKTAQKAIAAE